MEQDCDKDSKGKIMTTTRNKNIQQAVDQVLMITRVFDAPRKLVFKAWTEPESLKRWWSPKDFTCPFSEVDLRPGGKYLNCMRSPEGKDYWSQGVYRQIVEPERIVYTDTFADENGNTVSPESYGLSSDWPAEALVEVNFAEHGGKTEVTIRHSPIKPGSERDMCRQGWNECLDKLAYYLAQEQQSIPRTMKAVAIDRFGGIETLKLQTLPIPKVGPDEILIRTELAGVGVWDIYEREGGFAKLFGIEPKFPYILGSDGAGKVMAVGERVKKFKQGAHVYGFSLLNPKGGFYAEYIVLKADHASIIPDNLMTEQAGAMPVDAMTALRGLDDTLGIKRGQSVLIFGASGGIGHMALQLAKRMGASVLAVASGEDGMALAKRLGADATIDGHKDDIEAAARKFAPDGLDAALLTAGGKAAEKALAVIRDGGRVAYPNGVLPVPQVRSTIRAQSYDGMPDPQAIEKLNHLIKSGPFEVHIARTFPLEKAAEAHRALNEHYLGKLALRPS